VPFIQSKVITLGRSLIESLLAALSTRPGAALLVTPKVHLFTAGPNPVSENAAVGDFVEASFVGYVAQTLPALLGPINLPAGDGEGVHSEVDFLAGAVVPPGQVIIGYWIDDGVTTFYGGEVFPNAIPITVIGDFISLDVVLPVGTPTTIS